MVNNKTAFKSGIWYTISNFLVKSVGLITTPIFTRLLTQEEFGNYNNYTSWLALITIFTTLKLEASLISAKFDYKDNFDGYILSVTLFDFINCFLWIIIFNIFSDTISNFMGLETKYINIMLLYLFFLPLINMFQARESYLFEYKYTVLVSIAVSVFTALCSVILVVFLPDKLCGRIIGSVLPTVLIGMIILLFFIKKAKYCSWKYIKYALPICLPYIPHALSLTLLNSTDRVMIDKFCGPSDTALYSLAYTCGSLVTMLMTSMNSAFAPWLGEKLQSNSFEEIRKFSKKYILSFFVLCFGIMLISPEALLVLGGQPYMEAKYVMIPVSVGCFFQFLYTLFVNIEQFKKKTIGMAIASAIAAITNLLLNYIFIPKYGYLAAAYTTLIGYIVLLLIHMWLVNKAGMSKAYDYRFVLLFVVVGLITILLITLLYFNDIVRYITIIIYIIFMIYVIKKYMKIILQFIINR